MILNSYDQGFDFGRETIDSLTDAIVDEIPNVSLSIVYMDTHQLSEKVAWPITYNRLKQKFGNIKPTTIVAMDNSALDFVVKYKTELFDQIPTVFSGVNFFEPKMLGDFSQCITGITEDFSFRGFARTVLFLHPNVERVLFLHDDTLTGHLISKTTSSMDSIFTNAGAEIEHLVKYTFEELTKTLRELNKNDVVFISSIHRDVNGATLGSSNAEVDYLRRNIPFDVPIYSYWGDIYNLLLIGGEMLIAQNYGEQIARKVLRVMKNKSIKKEPIEPPETQTIFFYDKMLQFGIRENQLPTGVKIIGKSEGFTSPSTIVYVFIVLVIIQVGIIILFIIHRKKHQRQRR